MDEDRPWLGEEPSARPDLTFPPGLTAIAVFLAVAAPIVTIGIAHDDGTNKLVVALGIVVATVVAVVVFVGLTARGGRGPDVRGRL